jgi:branched-chain amino acid transport system permease protein
VRSRVFLIVSFAVAAAFFLVARLIGSEYLFFAGYVVLQFIVLATAWNILGGYCGYVNFGSAAFFALGAYTSVFFHKAYPLPIPVLILLGGIVSGIVGFGMGYLTLRLRGAFFAIATLALAVVLQTLIINWQYVGGSRGAYAIRPATIDILGFALPYMQYLFALMLILAVAAVSTARLIERSRLGYGFATIRDDELAAEACGVPTLRLKLIATTLSGALMGMAGAPFPYYITYIEPSSAFGLAYAVNSIAMPMIGGTASWIGPLVGAILLGSIQEIARVTISSAVNLLIVGVLLVAFVIIAPNGLVGLVQDRLNRGGADDRSAAAGFRRGQALRRLRRAGRHRPRRRARRAPRPDRTERFRQVDAGQLHLRHLAERDRCRDLRRPQDRRAAGAPAHYSRACAFVSAAAAVPLALGRRQPAHSAALCGEGPARPGDFRSRARCALRRVSAPGRARPQGRKAAARPDPGRDAQARARARDGCRAEAPDRR